ncbi:glycosyltransferase family 4 protein [Methyloterricola oryzae]|uniref:glycosyltransferase family 4 protein n=1 Tax=Methyloterricola oryzae TaxID=1495050 RepID=UPI0005EB7439|nr:glycosyltransferase family 4 protein [Methyloterricola oryzae]
MGTAIPANERLADVLRQSFPEYTVDIIDLGQILKERPVLHASCLLAALIDYGPDILARRRSLRACAMRTRFFFEQVKKLLRSKISPERYAFSIQIQSLFDGGCPGVRHYVYTDHTHLANLYYKDFDRSQLYKQAWIDLERSVYHNADKVFTRSSNVSRSVIEQYGCPPNQVACVYAGSNATTTRPDDHQPDYSKGNILFVGLDWERKGGPTLLQAFRKVLEKRPDASLTLVGCTPEVDIPQCKVVGRVPLEDVNRYYREASIFCMPTHLEPFGIVFVEALTYKLPIVATTIGALPDIVADGVNGYLLEPGDSEGIASRLLELLEDPDKCRRFGEKGFELACDRYDWQRVGERMREHILRGSASR